MKSNAGKKYKNGFGLLEAVVGISIISISIMSLMGVFQISHRAVSESIRKTQAAFLAEEGIEAIKTMRDSGWDDNIASASIGTGYYLEFNGTAWKSTTANHYIDGIFERKFILESVYRDSNDDIVQPGGSGVVDQDARKAVVYISWLGRSGTTTKSISAYITNLFNN